MLNTEINRRKIALTLLITLLLLTTSRWPATAQTPTPQDPATAQTGRLALDDYNPVTFETDKQPTTEIHVAESGDDNSGDGSLAAPYRSIARAVQDATPGTAIRIHAGSYANQTHISNLSGTEAAPIWIGGVDGETKPIIEGGSQGLHFSRVRYLIVHDLEIRDSNDNGINCDDGGDYADAEATRYVIFRGLYVHHVGGTGNQDCLKLSGVNDYHVLNSEFAYCGGGTSGSGVDHVGCHQGVLAGNYFHDTSGNAVQCKGGSEDIEIRMNRMIDCGERAVNMGGSTGFTFFRPPLSTTQPNYEARDIRVVANVMRGSVTPLAFVGCVECLAAHNTIINPDNWLMRILQETVSSGEYDFLPCSNNRVANNLFYFDRSALSAYEMINIGGNTAPETFTFNNNLWYAHNNASQSQPPLPVSETDGIAGQDPQLVDVAGEDYHLQSSSPAIGQGTPLSGVTYDFSNQRYGQPPSIGAFAFNTLTHPLYLPLALRSY